MPPKGWLLASASDDMLVLQAQGGSAQAFAVLLDRYTSLVRGQVCARHIPVTDTDDVVNTIGAAVWEGLPRFRREGRFGTWLYAITEQQCAEYWRRKARCQRLATALGIRQSVPPGGDGAFDETRWRMFQEAIERELSQIQDQPAAAFSLVCIEGYTCVEAAERLGVSYYTVRHWVRQVRKLLRSRLRGWTDPQQ